MEEDFTFVLRNLKKRFLHISILIILSLALLPFFVFAFLVNQPILGEALLLASLFVLVLAFYLFKKIEEESGGKMASFVEVYRNIRKRVFVMLVICLVVVLPYLFYMFSGMEGGMPILYQNLPTILLLFPALAQALVAFSFLRDIKPIMRQLSRNEKELKEAGLM